MHNVDVLSSIDLARMIEFHTEHNALATLAVAARTTSRPLLFDAEGQLRGRGAANSGEPAPDSPAQGFQSLAFSGIHVLSPRIFPKLIEEGAFSIVDAYLRARRRRAKASSASAPTARIGAISAGRRISPKRSAIWKTGPTRQS